MNLGLGETVAIGLASGLAGWGLIELRQAQPTLPLIAQMDVLGDMSFSKTESVAVIALSGAAGNLIGRPALKYIAPMIGITVQGA